MYFLFPCSSFRIHYNKNDSLLHVWARCGYRGHNRHSHQWWWYSRGKIKDILWASGLSANFSECDCGTKSDWSGDSGWWQWGKVLSSLLPLPPPPTFLSLPLSFLLTATLPSSSLSSTFFLFLCSLLPIWVCCWEKKWFWSSGIICVFLFVYCFCPSIPFPYSTYVPAPFYLSLLFLSCLLYPILFPLSLLQSLSLPAVTIGFSPDSYTATEDSGSITFTVALLDGTLGREVEVTFTTADGTAIGEHLVW